MLTLEAAVHALDYPLKEMCKSVIDDARFLRCPGGATRHHQYKGGLAVHTTEVMNFARSFVEVKDLEIMTVAAIFHDRNKIFEYSIKDDGTIEKLPYRKLIGHVVGSFMFFRDLALLNRLPSLYIDEVGHILLSHHGRLEWRSPVEPQTKLAHLFHIADVLSMEGKSNL
jgi:3'-5' exoribonuclease